MRIAESRAARRAARVPAGRIAGPGVPLLQAGRTDCDHHALVSTLANSVKQADLLRIVSAVARRRYGIRADDAEDIFQDAVVTYLEVQQRYPADANHFGLLVGVFHRKALKSLTHARRHASRIELLAARLSQEQRAVELDDSPDGETLRSERDAAIRSALAALPRDAREILLSIAGGTERRLDVITRLGINPNTFDSRLHLARKALRHDLARRDGF